MPTQEKLILIHKRKAMSGTIDSLAIICCSRTGEKQGKHEIMELRYGIVLKNTEYGINRKVFLQSVLRACKLFHHSTRRKNSMKHHCLVEVLPHVCARSTSFQWRGMWGSNALQSLVSLFFLSWSSLLVIQISFSERKYATLCDDRHHSDKSIDTCSSSIDTVTNNSSYQPWLPNFMRTSRI